MSKPQLVIDAAGVIVTNFSSAFLQEVSETYHISNATMHALLKSDIRRELWTGVMSERQFWMWFQDHCPELDAGHLKLLPAAQYVERRRISADIHVLSNHRHEWLIDVLEPLREYLHSITISSEVGCCKPDPAIYQHVHNNISDSGSIIFVDDQERNLIPARDFGWTTILADAEGKWTRAVSERLNA